jgi:RNA polymerase sigma factor (sigma-70 family)
LDELLKIHVSPIIRQVLRQRLGLYVSAQGVSSKHGAEDLYQEAMTRMIQVLRADLTTIGNLEHYVSRVASNICADFLRSKKPRRARLKNALRDVFRRHRDLASWQHESEVLCGLAAWRNTEKHVVRGYYADTMLDAFLSIHFAGEDVRAVPLSRLVVELFDWIGRPVQLDVLVQMLAYLLDIKEQPIESFDDHVAAEYEVQFLGSIRSTEFDVEINEMLGLLWRMVKRLPPKQRDAFALRFQDPDGRDLFTVLLAAGIAELNDLAEGLGRSIADIMRLWMLMPMDSQTAASGLNTSLNNVYKWLFHARRRLKAEFRGKKS